MPDSLSCSLQMTDNDHQFCTMKWKLWSGYANEAGDQPLWSRKSPTTSQIFMIFLRHTTGLFLLSQLKTQSDLCRCLTKIPNYRSHQIQTCKCLKLHYSIATLPRAKHYKKGLMWEMQVTRYLFTSLLKQTDNSLPLSWANNKISGRLLMKS